LPVAEIRKRLAAEGVENNKIVFYMEKTSAPIS
jgi:hypothetical protein